jgi:hypothetical protein
MHKKLLLIFLLLSFLLGAGGYWLLFKPAFQQGDQFCSIDNSMFNTGKVGLKLHIGEQTVDGQYRFFILNVLPNIKENTESKDSQGASIYTFGQGSDHDIKKFYIETYSMTKAACKEQEAKKIELESFIKEKNAEEKRRNDKIELQKISDLNRNKNEAMEKIKSSAGVFCKFESPDEYGTKYEVWKYIGPKSPGQQSGDELHEFVRGIYKSSIKKIEPYFGAYGQIQSSFWKLEEVNIKFASLSTTLGQEACIKKMDELISKSYEESAGLKRKQIVCKKSGSFYRVEEFEIEPASESRLDRRVAHLVDMEYKNGSLERSKYGGKSYFYKKSENDDWIFDEKMCLQALAEKAKIDGRRSSF